MSNPLVNLLIIFVPFSLVALGGGNSVLPGIEHQVVGSGLLTADAFLQLFAVARVAPGPGSMLVTLIGWEIAGWAGALVATLAFFVPSSLLCVAFVSFSNLYRDRHGLRVLEAALAPIGVGLLLSGTIAILRISEAGWISWAVAGGVMLLGIKLPKLHPFVFLAAAGLCFWAVAMLAWPLPA